MEISYQNYTFKATQMKEKKIKVQGFIFKDIHHFFNTEIVIVRGNVVVDVLNKNKTQLRSGQKLNQKAFDMLSTVNGVFIYDQDI